MPVLDGILCRLVAAPVTSSAVIGKPKMTFKTTSHAVQVSSFLNRGRDPNSFGFRIASMMLGLRVMWSPYRLSIGNSGNTRQKSKGY
jgi:hypothetical protein